MRIRIMAVLVTGLVFLTGLVGCSPSPVAPSPIIAISGISGGDVIVVGQSVTISWRCLGCEQISATAVSVSAVNVKTRQSVEIGFGPLSGSKTWNAGETTNSNNFRLIPGTYELQAVSEPLVQTSVNGGYYEAIGHTDIFRLTLS